MTRSGLEVQNGMSFSGIEDKPLFMLIVFGIIIFFFFLKHFCDNIHKMDQNIERLRKNTKNLEIATKKLKEALKD